MLGARRRKAALSGSFTHHELGPDGLPPVTWDAQPPFVQAINEAAARGFAVELTAESMRVLHV